MQSPFLSNAKAAITFSVDDCVEDTCIVMRDLLEEFSMCGTFNVIADFAGKKIGGVKFASWNLLSEIIMSGNELASHSMTHKTLRTSMIPPLTKVVNAARYENPFRFSYRLYSTLKRKPKFPSMQHLSFEDELRLSKKKIQENTGSRCEAYVYPGGSCNAGYKQMVMKAGYKSARSGYVGYNRFQNLDVFALKVQVWDSKVGDKTARLWADEALTHNLWLIEVIHSIDDSEDIYSARLKDLKSHFQYVAGKRDYFTVSTQSKIAYFPCSSPREHPQ